jgi:2,4-dienoyl-CoA reductase-like NADH-dependent reductase (Old Yellow Enzyme family)
VDGGLVDFVAVAKDILADYEWANKIKNGQEVNKCFKCKPMCQWLRAQKFTVLHE